MTIGCETGSIKVVDGQDTSDGRIEICFDNLWGTICSQSWDKNDALIACKQLGFSTEFALSFSKTTSAAVSGYNHFGSVTCVGTENTLLECVYDINHSCDNSGYAIVSCLNEKPDVFNENAVSVSIAGYNSKLFNSIAEQTFKFVTSNVCTSYCLSNSGLCPDNFQITSANVIIEYSHSDSDILVLIVYVALSSTSALSFDILSAAIKIGIDNGVYTNAGLTISELQQSSFAFTGLIIGIMISSCVVITGVLVIIIVVVIKRKKRKNTIQVSMHRNTNLHPQPSSNSLPPLPISLFDDFSKSAINQTEDNHLKMEPTHDDEDYDDLYEYIH
jgi:hypothetical protein